MKNIDTLLQNFIDRTQVEYQKISQEDIRTNTYFLNDYQKKKSVTLVDRMHNQNDPNFYFDLINFPDRNTDMFQIHFNVELLDESKLFIILSEIFLKNNPDISFLETLMRPLFNDNA